jgi:hypothetical protein
MNAMDPIETWHDAVTFEAMERRIKALENDNKYMINLAGEAIGTDPSLRSSACVKVLVDHIETVRNELAHLRENR